MLFFVRLLCVSFSVVEVENTKATYAGKSEDGALYQFTDAHSGEPIEVSAALLGEKAAYLEGENSAR